ncbi:WecB/TagA/CpsF family glycosyltransferase [Clostridium sp. YIM B02515]|uniref:N-acetylglucosaminyldiphosphoundecaprenol N-acetyl-beta-D-mannosaminyltransferase n=1 Tax=Clostridium rhizosphaerae TaxID=2803861 RepID=A0ABS1TEC6_9CLOT|nr:WecB/TagA/CpsF family glycosyltransferase [Clostridium rhizosphaerae]MBL4937422.1 WecB/TagA/CpsF family glycosyltransferase [Clostridium rhizosphaerae]
MRDIVKILGVPFNRITTDGTVDIIENQINSDRKKPYHIITGNPEIVVSYKKEKVLQDIIDDTDLITPDGVGIILASKWKKDLLPERVTGVDLLARVLDRGNERGWSFYFLGADEETNKKAVEIIKEKNSNIVVTGRHNGFFNKEEEEKIIEEISNLKPDILIVALGAPRAEKWIYNNKLRLNAKVTFGVGGSLDVIAGKVKRAPLIWQKLNIEWLHRLLSQPSRWRRQLVLPVFAWKAFGEAVKENVFHKKED